MKDTKIKEISFDAAVDISKKNGSKLVWLGVEPVKYISDLLGIGKEYIFREDPETIIYGDSDKLKKLDGCVLMCYHGNTSGFLSGFLKKQHSIETYNLKGGITAIVGEIF